MPPQTPGPHFIKSCYDSNSCWNVNFHWKSQSGSRIFTVVIVVDIPAGVAIISTVYEMGPRGAKSIETQFRYIGMLIGHTFK